MPADEFYGLPTRCLDNGHLRLEYLEESGPRIVRLFPAGSNENLLAEVPGFTIDTPNGVYRFHGGHRLWQAPEAFPDTYLPDDGGLEITHQADGVELTQPASALYSVRKSMRIQLHPGRAALTIYHTLRNEGQQPMELSAWAITQLRLGGVAVLPQPGTPTDASGLLPNRRFALWPYSRWSDPRLQLHDSFILFQAQPLLPAFKIGYLNTHGWMGYWFKGFLFCKRFDPGVTRIYPDFGCNAEAYCNDQVCELETLGPLVVLAPGESASHVETWEITRGLKLPGLEDAPGLAEEIRQALLAWD